MAEVPILFHDDNGTKVGEHMTDHARKTKRYGHEMAADRVLVEPLKKRAPLAKLDNGASKIIPLMPQSSSAPLVASSSATTASTTTTESPLLSSPIESPVKSCVRQLQVVQEQDEDDQTEQVSSKPTEDADVSDEESVASQQPHQPQIIDIDIGHNKDTQRAIEYVDQIMTYLMRHQHVLRHEEGYMRRQRDINENMRTILVDWLVEVCLEYKQSQQTLFLAVNYIDRFLSSMSVQRGKLQLVGVCCLFVASKYEEIMPPSINDFVYITDNTYTRDQVLRMEQLVLKVLCFDLGAVTINQFLPRFLLASQAGSLHTCFANYVSELSLLDFETFQKYCSSTIAASAVCLANIIVSPLTPYWTATLEHYTHLTLAEITECVRDLFALVSRAPAAPQQAIREKYNTPEQMRIASTVLPNMLPL